MRSNSLFTYVAAAACLGLAGCASDGSSILTTASVQPAKPVVAAVDPACLALQNRIELLREEGTVAKVEKAASGKTKTVVIKRAALGKVAEFNQANAEFRQRCSKLPPQRTASIPKPAAAATTAQAAATSPAAAAAAPAQKPQVAAQQAATLTRQ
ncbi:MAG: hypothetical protein AAGB04_13050 [Pseudomonadota bacterium]